MFFSRAFVFQFLRILLAVMSSFLAAVPFVYATGVLLIWSTMGMAAAISSFEAVKLSPFQTAIPFLIWAVPMLMFMIFRAEYIHQKSKGAYIRAGIFIGSLVAFMDSFPILPITLIGAIGGAVSGFVFWYIAGRFAGSWRKAIPN
jgi:hypothetical protein